MKKLRILKKLAFYVVAVYAIISFVIVVSIVEESGFLTMLTAVANFAGAALLLRLVGRDELNKESNIA